MLKLVGTLALVSVAYAAVAIFSPEQKPPKYADQEGCYLSKFDRVLPYNQPYYPGNDCAQYVCQNSTNATLYETCGSVAVRNGCQLSAVDLSKNYPDCCGKEVCAATTTTQAPTTEAPTSRPPSNQVVARASAKSGGGQEPVTEIYTSGPGAAASATAS